MILFGLVFLVAFLITAYFAFALLYHWLKYGFMYPAVWIMMPIYIAGTVFLLLISFAAYSAL